jgi:adenylate cyclase
LEKPTLENSKSRGLVEFLREAYVKDDEVMRMPHDTCGWRSLVQIAAGIGITPKTLYGKKPGHIGLELQELIRDGLIEMRYFEGQRGRGGEVMRCRISDPKNRVRSAAQLAPTFNQKGLKAKPLVAESKSEPIVLSRNRLAVLPFTNMSPDPADEYFADGMTEELISTLSKISGLKVIARTSVMRYKYERGKDIVAIGEELKVGTVLEGSIRKAGNRLRITAQLIDASKNEHLWSESYDRKLEDVFEIQVEISETVAHALKVTLLSREKTSIEKEPTKSTEAHTLYLKGTFYFNERTEENVRKAIVYFERAVSVDPTFALAYCGLADSYNILSDYGWMEAKLADPLAKKYSLKALRLDAGLAEAHASHGLALYRSWEFASSERELKKAIELRPSYAASHHWYALLLQATDRVEESWREEKLALEIDPYSRVINMGLANALYFLGKYDESMKIYNELLEANPDFEAARAWRLGAQLMLGQYDVAIREARHAFELDRSVTAEGNLAWVLAAAGDKREAEKVLEHLIERSSSEHVSALTLGQVRLALGDLAEGFALLDRAFAERDTSARGFRIDPWFRQFHSDPRWEQIDQRMRASNNRV